MVILTFELAPACEKINATKMRIERETVRKNAPVCASQTFGVVNEDALALYKGNR